MCCSREGKTKRALVHDPSHRTQRVARIPDEPQSVPQSQRRPIQAEFNERPCVQACPWHSAPWDPRPRVWGFGDGLDANETALARALASPIARARTFFKFLSVALYLICTTRAWSTSVGYGWGEIGGVGEKICETRRGFIPFLWRMLLGLRCFSSASVGRET